MSVVFKKKKDSIMKEWKIFNAIIFDMDGVLFDTETFYYHRREKIFLAEKRD